MCFGYSIYMDTLNILILLSTIGMHFILAFTVYHIYSYFGHKFSKKLPLGIEADGKKYVFYLTESQCKAVNHVVNTVSKENQK